MDGWIQHNWLEATVAWCLVSEMLLLYHWTILPSLACSITENNNEKWWLRKHHQELSNLLPQLLSLSAS